MVNLDSVSLLSKQTCISEGIQPKFYLTQAGLIHHLSKIDFISITCNGWTSPTSSSLLGVTAHWITTNCKIHGVSLELK